MNDCDLSNSQRLAPRALPLKPLLLVGIVFVSATIATGQDQTGNSKSEKTVPPSVRRKTAKLAQRFRRASNDWKQREQIADEAIQQGKPFVEKILSVVKYDKTKLLKSYGVSFSKQIDRAKRITAKGVVASSEKLKKTRRQLIQLATIETKLLTFLDPPLKLGMDEKQNEDAETKPEAKLKSTSKTEFEKFLQTEEEGAIKKWLVSQGYGRLTPDESAVIAAINQLRTEAGLNKLEIDYKLCFAARDHSNDMSKKQFFSHQSPVRGKKTLGHRAYRVGTVAFAENIVLCKKGESPVLMWLNSKPHKRNMLGKGFNTIGVGRVGNYYTAMFGRKRTSKPKNSKQNKNQ